MMNASPSASFDSLGKMSTDSTTASAQANLPKAANFLSQLEIMMGAVKKEANALENMKMKLKEMDEMKSHYHDLQEKVKELENKNLILTQDLQAKVEVNTNLHHDMQRLNDLFTNDHNQYLELQQKYYKLEQEQQHLLHEKEFFLQERQKLNDIKNVLKTTKTQYQQLQQNVEEERKHFQNQQHLLEKEISEKNHHIHELEVNREAIVREYQEKDEVKDKIIQEFHHLRDQTMIRLERQGMILEDSLSQQILMQDRSYRLHHEYAILQAENVNIQHKLLEKDEKMKQMMERMVSLEKTQYEKVNAINDTIANLQDALKDLTNKNNSLAQENTTLKQKISIRLVDEEKTNVEKRKLEEKVRELENSLSLKEMDHLQAVRSISSQRDDQSFKIESLTSQLEALQSQMKGDQVKYWEELKLLKENESQLLEETEKLNNELQEKMVQVHILETEKLTNESMMKNEVNGASSIIETLKMELEKRLAELVQLREERDQHRQSKESLEKTVENLKIDLQKADQLFKKTIETDRNKMKQELQSRSHRIKQLENEKQELLNETQELMNQLTGTQKQHLDSKTQYEDTSRQYNQLLEQFNLNKTRIVELQNELKRLTILEEELKSEIDKNDKRSQLEITKLDMMVKEARKSSSQQVLELTNQVKSLFEELDENKRLIDESQDRERKIIFEKDKIKTDYDHLVNKFNLLQEEQNKEISILKRDLQDLRNKHKLTIEQKTKLEMDIVGLSKEVNRNEMEINKHSEGNRLLEMNYQQAQDQIKSMKSTIETIQEQRNQFQYRLQELENVIVNKNQAIESLHNDVAQVERDGLVEIRRLRLLLQSTDQELNDLRPTHTMLMKELEDTKANLSRALANNNSTVNTMLDDLHHTEEILAKERKTRQNENEEWRQKTKELEFLVEKYKQELDEIQSKTRSDRQEKELRTTFLEKEIDRMKGQFKEKDQRIEELEQQHHIHRKRSLEMKEMIDQAQNEVIQLKTMLEMEQSHRKRLETRLRQQLTSSDANNNKDMLMTIPSSGSLSSRTRSARGERNAMAVDDNMDYSTIASVGGGMNGAGYGGGNDEASVLSGYSRNGNSSNGNVGTYSMQGGAMKGDGLSVDNTVTYFDQGHSMPQYSPPPDDMLSISSRGRIQSAHHNHNHHRVSESPQLAPLPLSPARPAAVINNTPTASSPAVDRVSAALALKLAQQQRSNISTNGTVTGFEALSAVQRTSRPPSASIADRDMEDQYGGDEDDIFSVPPPDLVVADQRQMQRLENNNAVEESIRRTQMVLNRRLGIASSSSSGQQQQHQQVELSPSAATVHSTGSGRSGSANSANGRSATKLMETIQQAHSLYPASPLKSSSSDDRDAIQQMDLPTPALQPAGPPVSSNLFRNVESQQQEDDDDEDGAGLEDEEDDEEGPIVSSTYRTTSGKDLLRFQLSSSDAKGGGSINNQSSIANTNTTSTGTSNNGGGGGKKKKKKASSSSSAKKSSDHHHSSSEPHLPRIAPAARSKY